MNNRQIFTAESGRNIIEENENTTIVKEINIKMVRFNFYD
jgi:hypothetical protein